MLEQPVRYLIVEDDETDAHMMRKLIRDHNLGEVIAVVPNGRLAEKLVHEHQPDVVLLDLLMPDQLGTVTLRNLRMQRFNGAVVIVSSVTEESMISESYREGAMFFLHKPLNRVEVQTVLRNVGQHLRLQQALQSIHRALQPFSPDTASSLPRREASREQFTAAVREVLAELGILGHSATEDLLRLAELAREGRTFRDLRTALEALLEVASRTETNEKPITIKGIEQRLRRAATTALAHLAALGLEDYSDERFTRLAPSFFDFTEVRVAMSQLRTGAVVSGGINLKKFLDAFLYEVERRLMP